MQLKVFSFFDTKVGIFGQPFFMHHVGQAIRAGMELGSDTKTQIGRYPSDFALFEIGLFDDATGVITATAPANHGVVSSFLVDQPSFKME